MKSLSGEAIVLSDAVIEAINFIKDNLEEKLTVDLVANHVHLSKYHFNRLFKKEVGESLYTFIKRLKMEQSMINLIIDEKRTITEISAMYGYSSSNYNVAFKNQFKDGPSDYRQYYTESVIKEREGHYTNLLDRDYEFYQNNIEIVNIDEMRVLYKKVVGDYRLLSTRWKEFAKEYPEVFEEKPLQFEIAYNDPLLTASSKCMTDLCVLVDENNNAEPIKFIKGGTYAVYHFQGAYGELFGIYQGLLGCWMPKSVFKFDLMDKKIFSMIRTYDVENDFYQFDIFIPEEIAY